MTDIVYEPHPVSPERKAELRAQGKTIIDARYKPAHLKDDEPVEEITRETIATMKRQDVIDLLELHGVVGATGKLSDLRKWLVEVMFIGGE